MPGDEVMEKLNHAEKFKRWLWRKFDKSITNDDVRQLPERVMYPMGFLLSCISIFVFLFFCVTGIINQLNAKYLAPNDAGSGQCDSLTREVTMLVVIDGNGFYNGDQEFVYAEAIYQMDFNRLTVTPRGYSMAMQNIYTEIIRVGEESTNYTLNR